VAGDARPGGQAGDYFGSIVNFAARLVDEAVTGEVLIDADSAAPLTRALGEPAGRRSLKGFADPVRVPSITV
jgi:class 3 adenylate cyclase